MRIYCSHRYGGDDKNKALAEEKIKSLQIKDKDNVYISPIHCFGFMYNDLAYDDGIHLCLELLKACDKMLVLSDESIGVKIEIETANKLGIPVEYTIFS